MSGAGNLSLRDGAASVEQRLRAMAAEHAFCRHCLEVCNRHNTRQGLLAEIVGDIQSATDCAAVGIRLRDAQGNVPYEAYSGFSDEFYREENLLSVYRDRCLCIRVISGQPDILAPFWTPYGSFVVNHVPRLMAECPGDTLVQLRGACHRYGYQSMAMVPIRMSDRILGLVHVADPRPDLISDAMVGQLESLSPLLASAIDRVEALAALRESQRQLAALVEAKHAFLSQVSHEIRTPLTLILGFAETLLDDNARQADSAARRRTIETIVGNGRHLVELIRDVFDWDQVGSERFKIAIGPCRPMVLVREVVQLMRLRASQKKLRLELRQTGPMPRIIQSDPRRLRQILINLLDNAVKFTLQGEVRLHCRLVGAPDGSPLVQWEVSDTGPGISPVCVARLFEPFYRPEGQSRQIEGTGLGLAIAKQLIERLGGTITATSQPGHGATFCVTLPTGALEGVPLDEPDEEPPATPDNAVADARGVPTLSGHVLVVEDTPDVQQLLDRVLRAAGLDVSMADNGESACHIALERLQAGQPFDLILMDLELPSLDGLEATLRLRAAGYAGPIVALTAHVSPADRDRCLAAGCDGWATKPLDHDALLATLQCHLPHCAPPADSTAVHGKTLIDALPEAEQARMRKSYLTQLRDQTERLQQALDQGQFDGVLKIVHSLRGTAPLFGFNRIGRSAGPIEDRARAGQTLADLLNDVAELLRVCRAELSVVPDV